jgi:hypothetical protein
MFRTKTNSIRIPTFHQTASLDETQAKAVENEARHITPPPWPETPRIQQPIPCTVAVHPSAPTVPRTFELSQLELLPNPEEEGDIIFEEGEGFMFSTLYTVVSVVS